MKPVLSLVLCAAALPLLSQVVTWTTQEDHQDMLRKLGIETLRPGPSGNESAPNHANYDESRANPFPDYPDALVLKNGERVTTADQWKKRRAEIVEDFEREVLGRVPANAPKIAWTVTNTVSMNIGAYPVVVREIAGHADNAATPEIKVDIRMVLVLPAGAKRPVPVMIMFGRGVVPGTPPPPGWPAPPPSSDPPAIEQLIAAGWGYADLAPYSIQADNGAGLTRGVIGLANSGQARKPEDWGALRAWAWGASRALDYLETVREVNSRQVGIEGVSRFGKAALVTMAFDERFAVVLVGSSGEGGTKPHRRNLGEAVENLTGSGEYHWMAGNFLKYGAGKASFGSKTAGDIPVDSNELIALCAPRSTFISYGIPEKGDSQWLDQQGSFMATVAAQPVFRLLRARGLGVADDYRTAKMPPYNTPLLDGVLAWRQHDGGHTDGPNWKYFIPWANRQLNHAPPADRPSPRVDSNSIVAHSQLLAKAKAGGIDVYFLGDSITRRWGATDYPEFLANWKKNFHGWNAADFGWGADRTENILWRLENGEIDGVNPKVIVLQAGTNNIPRAMPPEHSDSYAADITAGMAAIVLKLREKAPNAAIVLTGIFPRNDTMAVIPLIDKINSNLKRMAADSDGHVRYLDINLKLAGSTGKLFDGMMDPRDKLHPLAAGYQVWADALKPLLAELLGPPAKDDHAPPPTGDPGAARH